MPELKDFNFWALVAYLFPGVFLIQARSFAALGRFAPITKDSIVGYILVTAIYGLVLWSMGVALQTSSSISGLARDVLIKYFIAIPLVLGFMFGLLERRGIFQRLFIRVGINIPLPIQTAWAEVFSSMPVGTYLILLLGDGTVYRAMVTQDSRFASDAENADLFIGQTFQQDWTPYIPQRGVYIRASEVKAIEIIRRP